ncbi:MAG: DUF192 domain-containing protein [Thermomicrobiales bacterium]
MTTFLLATVMFLTTFGTSLAQIAPPWRHQVAPLQTSEILVGGVPLTVELAYQPADLQRGLGYRDGLAPGTGMLFLFEQPAPRSFWMKGMRFCLDIIWIQDGVIQGAAENVCPDDPDIADTERPTQKSPVDVAYVLEVPAGWLAEHGLGAGTPVENLPYLVRTEEPTPAP